MPEDAITDALFKLKNFENAELVQKNELFMDYLQHGIEVRILLRRGALRLVYIADYKNPDNNSFVVANQWTFIENSNKRPDVLLFLNGLPVVLIELKSPSREETDASEAICRSETICRKFRQCLSTIASVSSVTIDQQSRNDYLR